MNYDNERCVADAEKLVGQFAGNRYELKKQIAGELNRYYTLGKYSVIGAVDKVVEKAKKAAP
jgi:hypothetical protein